ncbi:O-antigen ligase family protein [Mesorhizobium sp.]|uniref:O-antigen ligase family protein n=1 Tax=Mesorhizobium sp. TaxID=1871066 RepID=UPI00257D9C2D|nr:O-antigen ligase family protein [Mesorhizobium sp.]
MRYLLTFAILSLFLPIRLETGLVLLRPFEVIVLLALIIGLATGRWRNLAFSAGFLLLLPFLGWHMVSAFSVDAENGLRELLQMSTVGAFAFAIAQEARWLETQKAVNILLFGMVLILAYTINWHVAHGYSVGWKHLADPRLVFTFLPIALAGLLLFAKRGKRRALWFAWAGILPLLLLSGERKAFLIYLFLTAALLMRGRVAAMVPAIAAGFVGLFMLSIMVDNAYVEKQLQTIVNPLSMGQHEHLAATGKYAPGDTPSNVQRAFAFTLSKQLISEHPLVGVGTNKFKNIIDTEFSGLPGELRLGIHGEFQRIFTENGIIGLSLYVLIWLAAWFRLSRALSWALFHGLIGAAQARLLPLVLLVPCALYVGTEASGTRAFVTLSLVSLLPELTRHGLWLSLHRARRSHPRGMRHPRFLASPLPGNTR